MFTILLHSSKTMRAGGSAVDYQSPLLLPKAVELATYVQSLSSADIATSMQLSPKMAEKTHAMWQQWSTKPADQLAAMDAFLGDIYSGLQVQTFSAADRLYANEHLYILSGLYGVLRALDGIAPYRVEMGYRLPVEPYRNLYAFWGDDIARTLPTSRTILNLSAVEYTKVMLPHLPGAEVITPKFMTMNASGKPVFVTVHAKVARGAFARWVIQNQVAEVADLRNFTDLHYRCNASLSMPGQPVFVCKEFGGLGLSVRLT